MRRGHRWGALAHWGHGVSDKGLVDDGCSLDVWGNDDGMFPEIHLEGVSSPLPLGLHDVERHALEKVLQG